MFVGAIEMSGSGYAQWGLSNRGVSESRKLAEELGCVSASATSFGDSESLKNCLRNKTMGEFQEAATRAVSLQCSEQEVESLNRV